MSSAHKTIQFIKDFGLEKLQEELFIKVGDYPDRIMLNYDMIFSPKGDPVVQECRNLILAKSDLSVISHSFARFFNLGEFDVQDFEFDRAEFKLDGSIISAYLDPITDRLQFATRKSAFAEATTPMGITYRSLCEQAMISANIEENNVWRIFKEFNIMTLIFELVGPANRVVTRYDNTEFYLIGGRFHGNGKELNGDLLRYIAVALNIKRPNIKHFVAVNEVKDFVAKMSIEDEGCVLVKENDDFYNHSRIKVKNPGYLTLSKLRNNGVLTPCRIVEMLHQDNLDEYCSYFPEDKPACEPYRRGYFKLAQQVNKIWENNKHLTGKEFALSVISATKSKSLQGLLFATSKKQLDLPSDGLKNIRPEYIVDTIENENL